MNFRAGGDQDDGQHCNVIGIIRHAVLDSCRLLLQTDESMKSTQLNLVINISECQANHKYVCIEAPCFKGKKARKQTNYTKKARKQTNYTTIISSKSYNLLSIFELINFKSTF